MQQMMTEQTQEDNKMSTEIKTEIKTEELANGATKITYSDGVVGYVYCPYIPEVFKEMVKCNTKS